MNKDKVIRLFNIYGFAGGSFAGNVYDPQGIAPTLMTMSGGGNKEPLIVVEDERDISNR